MKPGNFHCFKTFKKLSQLYSSNNLRIVTRQNPQFKQKFHRQKAVLRQEKNEKLYSYTNSIAWLIWNVTVLHINLLIEVIWGPATDRWARKDEAVQDKARVDDIASYPDPLKWWLSSNFLKSLLISHLTGSYSSPLPPSYDLVMISITSLTSLLALALHQTSTSLIYEL